MDPQPTIGRIVVYRNRAGVDVPAIITALVDFPGMAHLTQFPPPGHGPDPANHQYGSPHDPEPRAGYWRFRTS